MLDSQEEELEEKEISEIAQAQTSHQEPVIAAAITDDKIDDAEIEAAHS